MAGTHRKRGRYELHGLTGTPECSSWRKMIQRCTNPNTVQFPYYGGRGIEVCERWFNSLAAFYEDMGRRPAGHTLDRVNVNGHYCRENCRWSTHAQQCKNKRTKAKRAQQPKVTWRELPRIRPQDIPRFWSKVDKSGGPDACWNWLDTLNPDGYGKFHLHPSTHWSEGRVHMFSATRISYKLAHGRLPNNRLVCHTCDNRRCVNPRHLVLGTQTFNMHDMLAKGRGRKARGADTGKAKLTEANVLSIRARYRRLGIGGPGGESLAAAFGVTAANIRAIVSRKTWKHVA